MTTIDERLLALRARIAAACAIAQRPATEVTLLAVSKTFGPAEVEAAAACGLTAFGENYIQEAVEKQALLTHLRPPPRWHCIGPIQSNKTRLVATHFDWAHTVDRLKIAQRLSEQRPAGLAPLNVCIQLNVDGGLGKSGISPADALALAREVAQLPNLALRGVMSIPEPAEDFDTQYELHSRARAVYEQLRDAGFALDTLSLGMSADLEAAIAAGSTMVRVGTALFGGRAGVSAVVPAPA